MRDTVRKRKVKEVSDTARKREPQEVNNKARNQRAINDDLCMARCFEHRYLTSTQACRTNNRHENQLQLKTTTLQRALPQ